MSSHERQFVQFAELAPDAIEFDNPLLEVAKNVTPSYGSYRPLEGLQRKGTVQDTEPVTGGYCHLVAVGAPDLRVQPEKEGFNSPVMTGNWYTKDLVLLDDADVENYDALVLGGFHPDDTTYIRSEPINAPGTDPEIRYRFADPPRTPVTTDKGDVTLRVRMRYSGGSARGYDTHEINWVLWDDDGAGQEIASGTFSFTEDTGEWQLFEVELEVAEMAKITDWAQVEIQLECDSTLDTADDEEYVVPEADHLAEGWEDQDGGTDDLFEAIDGLTNAASGDDAEYITSPQVPPGKSSVAIFRLGDADVPANPEDGDYNVFADFWSNKPNTSIKIQYIQSYTPSDDDDDDSDDDFITIADVRYKELFSKKIDNVSTSESARTELNQALSSVQAYAWAEEHEPGKDVLVAFTVTYGGASGGDGDKAYLVPTTKRGAWPGGVAGTISDIANVDDGDRDEATPDGITIQSGYHKWAVNLSDGPNRTGTSGHKVWVYASGAQSGEGVIVKLMNGTNEIDRDKLTFGTSSQWKSFTVRSGQASAIKDYADLWVEYVYTGAYKVSETYMEYPGDSAQLNIGDTYIDANRGLHAELSLVSLDSKNSKNNNLGDRNEIFVGTNSKIYEIEESGHFEDVSRDPGDAYGLAAEDDVAKLWSFTSFGDDVICTNYANEPQRRVFGDPLFTDLYDSVDADATEQPWARHAAVIGAQLVLADINPTSYVGGKPFHLWCSKPMDPQWFDAANADTLSALFALVGKPGAITGLIGGEYGTCYKRNSIWRMTFVGLPVIYNFDIVADGLGCSHPQSLVQAGADLYFWDSSGIFRLVNGVQPERISGGKIEKLIFDSKFEGNALFSVYGNDPRENEALVWGAYDAYSGLVWWVYRTEESSQFSMENMIVYSTVENRFTTVEKTDLDITMILGRANAWTNEPVLNRGVIGVGTSDRSGNTYIDYKKFMSDDTYRGTLKTKIISTVSWGYKPGEDAEVVAVRPVYSSEPQTVATAVSKEPNFQITTEAGQDAAFVNGYQTRTVNRSREGRDGWIPIKPSLGEYWRFTVEIPSLHLTNVKDFLGVQLKTVRGGDNN